MPLPTFLIIGAFKCGTTSLHYYLSLHPEIQVADMKETNFLSGPPNGVPYTPGAKRIKYLHEYEGLFDPAYRVRGESSPNYTSYPRREGTAERVSQIIPDAKLIYLVRDPVTRTVSHFHHRVSTEGERRSLSEALSDLDDPLSPYTCPSFYALQLDQYLRYFTQEQILVVDQADLLANRHETLREIFGFLTVDDSIVLEHFEEEINTAGERRTYTKLLFLIRWARASPLQRLPRGARVSLRDSFERLVSKPLGAPVLDDDLRVRLQRLYAGDVARLREMTGKAFSTWSI
jgi:Sulfotransferase domain